MRALVMEAVKEPLKCMEMEERHPGEGEVVVGLKAAALNRRDYWITQGLYPGIKTPVVLGSDGAGIVTRIGSGVSPEWLEQEVVLYPGLDWGSDPKAQAASFVRWACPMTGRSPAKSGSPKHACFASPVICPGTVQPPFPSPVALLTAHCSRKATALPAKRS